MIKPKANCKALTFPVKTLVLSVGLAALALGSLVACGKKSSDGGVMVGLSPAAVFPMTQIGYYSQTPNFVIPGYLSDARSRIQLGANFSAILRDAMGVCDREYISAGLASCSDWIGAGAHDLVIFTNGGPNTNSMRLIMRSTPSNGFSFGGGRAWYSLSLPDLETAILGFLGFPVVGNPQGIFNPMVLETTLWPINNSQGIELRAYGPRGSVAWNKLFQIQIDQGKLGDEAMNFKLFFDGKAAASGSMIRCQSQHCGLDASFFNGRL